MSVFLACERGEFRLRPEQPLIVRRGAAHELSLADPAVSRDEPGVARFVASETGVVLQPLVADCPILLNGERIQDERTVRAGDRVRIGHSVIVLNELSQADGGAEGIQTVRLRTEAARRRHALSAEADRLAQWSDSFDRVRAAASDEALAEIILDQLARLSESERILICGNTSETSGSFRELASRGLSAGEIESALFWFARNPPAAGPAAPTQREVTGRVSAQRGVIGCVEFDGGRRVFYLEPPALAPTQEIAHRGLSLLSNLLLLHQTLHESHGQRSLIRQLSETVRSYALPLDESIFRRVAERFVFRSARMQQTCRQLARAAVASSPVLLLGERGSGKQVAAEAIHSASGRRHREMVSVNLVESKEDLVEADLFGTTKGAFTGAVTKKGFLELADGTTLFIDEFGEISPSLQAKLLRVLERGEFHRLGEAAVRRVDVRLILATNRDLPEEVRRGRFRADLYDRINVIPIQMPPLRDRLDDVPVLAAAFLAESNEANGKRLRLSDEAVRHLMRYAWPGNVRVLRNYIERAVILSERREGTLGPDDLPPLGTPLVPAASDSPAAPSPVDEIVEELQAAGRTNQARLLRQLPSTDRRLTKKEWSERLQISLPVLRAELRQLVAHALGAGLDREFFESRVAMRPEDWREIDAASCRGTASEGATSEPAKRTSRGSNDE